MRKIKWDFLSSSIKCVPLYYALLAFWSNWDQMNWFDQCEVIEKSISATGREVWSVQGRFWVEIVGNSIFLPHCHCLRSHHTKTRYIHAHTLNHIDIAYDKSIAACRLRFQKVNFNFELEVGTASAKPKESEWIHLERNERNERRKTMTNDRLSVDWMDSENEIYT